ncbi:hypothetical protein TTHMIC_00026 [Tetrahymena thermophila SB210]|uniref:USP domain-containing protein n=1 Tax=Tetrahymena thermophila (strain SB210) TaxID=312017 RepID=A0A1B9C2G7_TETTS|nr:hypothetical protein TTHMIC_00026 [Tetrahymena thermophila SB210]
METNQDIPAITSENQLCSNFERFFKFCFLFEDFKNLIQSKKNEMCDLIDRIVQDDKNRINYIKNLQNYIQEHQRSNYCTLFESIYQLLKIEFENTRVMNIFTFSFVIKNHFTHKSLKDSYINIHKYNEQEDIQSNVQLFLADKNDKSQEYFIKLCCAPQIFLVQFFSEKNNKKEQSLYFKSYNNLTTEYRLMMDLTESYQQNTFHQQVYIQQNSVTQRILEQYQRIQEIQRYQQEEVPQIVAEKQYFFEGIQNYGQTCYFNSVIQILRLIYFQSMQFQELLQDLNIDNSFIQILLDLITKKSIVTYHTIKQFYYQLDNKMFSLDGIPRDCNILFSCIIAKIRNLNCKINDIFKTSFLYFDLNQRVYKQCCYNPLWLQINDKKKTVQKNINLFICESIGIKQKKIEYQILKDPEILILSVQQLKGQYVYLNKSLTFQKAENKSVIQIKYNLLGFIFGPKHSYVTIYHDDKNIYQINDDEIYYMDQDHQELYQRAQLIVYRKSQVQ